MSIDQRIYGYIIKEETFPDNSFIIKEGSIGKWVFVILEGQVKIKKKSSKGIVTINILKEGSIFGECEFFEKKTELRITSAVAYGTARVGLLDSDQLLKDYETISPQIKGLIRALVRRLKYTTESVVSMTAKAKENA
ncbi:MAG TPA: cyclic nucleotide-binding domain-containing protein [Desulfobacteraceae bacterium]|nr:cyclic nucleotide-binding domain-containing protein [Desulfobacteraceae bacterium]HPJ67188.1 cyclic nucleotide-binding domain-containing protein [Desulfobacteraceae bacterium]HPQ26848.1 cyclic nucleotide-binding domain-containing protein [Desulfobacteraceae bacterium]